MALNDPYARLFSIMGGYTPPEYSKIPTSGTSPYDFGLDPLNPYPTEQAISGETDSSNSDADEAEKEREGRSGGDHGDYVGSDRDYAYEPEYWGGYKEGAWAPDYDLGTSLKSLGYGKALGQALRKGGLLGSLLGLSGNKFNPLNDPAHIEGIKQAGTQFNFDPAMMETAIQNLYDGVSATNPAGTKTTGLLNGLLGGLFNEASPSKINATDTLKGMVGMAGPWADLIDWNQTNFTHFDPTSPNRLALGDVDAYRAAQMMDAYNSGFGVAPSQYGIGMYQNLAMDPTLKPGWMAQYNDALSGGNPIGIAGKMAAGIGLDSSEAGLAAGGGMGLNGKTGSSVGSFRDALDGWARGEISTKDMEKAFGNYKEKKSDHMSGKKGNDKSGSDKDDNGSSHGPGSDRDGFDGDRDNHDEGGRDMA